MKDRIDFQWCGACSITIVRFRLRTRSKSHFTDDHSPIIFCDVSPTVAPLRRSIGDFESVTVTFPMTPFIYLSSNVSLRRETLLTLSFQIGDGDRHEQPPTGPKTASEDNGASGGLLTFPPVRPIAIDKLPMCFGHKRHIFSLFPIYSWLLSCLVLARKSLADD